MRLVFPLDVLGTHTLNGTAVLNTDEGPFNQVRNQLDPCKVEAVYKQFKIRVLAVGINDEERKARAQTHVFQRYVRNLCDLDRKNFKRQRELNAHHH